MPTQASKSLPMPVLQTPLVYLRRSLITNTVTPLLHDEHLPQLHVFEAQAGKNIPLLLPVWLPAAAVGAAVWSWSARQLRLFLATAAVLWLAIFVDWARDPRRARQWQPWAAFGVAAVIAATATADLARVAGSRVDGYGALTTGWGLAMTFMIAHGPRHRAAARLPRPLNPRALRPNDRRPHRPARPELFRSARS